MNPLADIERKRKGIPFFTIDQNKSMLYFLLSTMNLLYTETKQKKSWESFDLREDVRYK